MNDARDVHARLVKLGYASTLLLDPRDLEALNTSLATFALQLRNGATGVFFFAGHGMTTSWRPSCCGKLSILWEGEKEKEGKGEGGGEEKERFYLTSREMRDRVGKRSEPGQPARLDLL